MSDDEDFYASEGEKADTEQEQPEAAQEPDPKPIQEDEDLEEGEEEDEGDEEGSDSVGRVREYILRSILTVFSGHRYHHREKRW